MPNELVAVATYPNAIEAHTARNYLEENEIEAFVADEYFSTLEFSNLSTIKLQVPVADASTGTNPYCPCLFHHRQ